MYVYFLTQLTLVSHPYGQSHEADEISHQASNTGRYAHIVLQGDAIKVCPVYGEIFHMYYNKYFSSLVTDYLRAYALRMKIK